MPVLDASLALKGPAGVTLDGAGVTARPRAEASAAWTRRRLARAPR